MYIHEDLGYGLTSALGRQPSGCLVHCGPGTNAEHDLQSFMDSQFMLLQDSINWDSTRDSKNLRDVKSD